MKKILPLLITLIVSAASTQAQDLNIAFKKASKELNNFNLSYNGYFNDEHLEILESARNNIDIATADPNAIPLKKRFKYWNTRSSIYSHLADAFIHQKPFNPKYELVYPNPAIETFLASAELLKVNKKKWELKMALDGILNAGNKLLSIGNLLYRDQDYKGAYDSFKRVLEARAILLENNNDGILPIQDFYNDQVFVTARTALSAGENAAALGYFEELYDLKYTEAEVYVSLSKLLIATDKTRALRILEEGRTKFPDDRELMKAEINLYADEGKINELIAKRETAINADPNNVLLITSFGEFYYILQQREEKADHTVKANEYAQKTIEYYNQALVIDPNNFAAVYRLASLQYDNVKEINKQLKELENDFSSTGMASYDKKKKERTVLLDKVLPYFKKAEKISPSDKNTLTALQEIFTLKNDLTTANEFKKRLEILQEGGTIDAAYFD